VAEIHTRLLNLPQYEGDPKRLKAGAKKFVESAMNADYRDLQIPKDERRTHGSSMEGVSVEAMDDYNTGNKYLRSGQFQKAVEAFTEALKRDPGYQQAYCNRGLAYLQLGETRDALENFRKALALNPKDNIALLNRSGIFLRMGKYDEAIADLDAALKSAPGYGKALGNRGAAYFAKGDYRRALEDLDAALKIERQGDEAVVSYYYKGQACEQLGMWDEALKTYEMILKVKADLKGQVLADVKERIADLKSRTGKRGRMRFWKGG
jgi:tetratricopeptide (TPR) repeat protein